ncbi:BrnA antitoxin family protein [Shinella sp.]|uniref:BrnA antitoxin family protein n=1 Tax=Shinella sp. TaxID=1870904 RepID=UPI003F6F630B
MSTTARRPREISSEEETRIQQGIADDPDNTEWTEEDFRKAKPFRDALPELAAAIDRAKAKRGRPTVDSPKQQISVRLDPDLIQHYKATGKGWQSRMNDDLRKAAGL